MRNPEDHPRFWGERCAQDIYNQPSQTAELLQAFGERVVDYYTGRHRDPTSPERQRAEGIFRTTAAVLQHAIEIELAKDMESAQQQELGFTELSQTIPSVRLDEQYITVVSEPYEGLTGRKWDFVRISSLFSLEAARRFMWRVLQEPEHWARPVYAAYKQNLPEYKQFNDKFVRFAYEPENPDRQAYTHVCDNAVNSNVTILHMLTAATRHEHHQLWLPGSTTTEALLSRTEELAWPDSTSKIFLRQDLGLIDCYLVAPFRMILRP